MDQNEDKKIRDLFGAFDPELRPRRDFMKELERRMDAVGFIRERQAAVARRRKRALAVASGAGSLAGFIFSRALPAVEGFLESAGLGALGPDALYLAGWALVASVAVAAAVGSYELSLSLPFREE